MERKNRGLSSLMAVTLILSALALILWGAGMYCLTAIYAEEAARQFYRANTSPVLNVGEPGACLAEPGSEQYLRWRFDLWDAVNVTAHAPSSPVLPEGGALLLPDKDYTRYHATAFFDTEGNILACSWEDYLYCQYYSQQSWDSESERYDGQVRIPFDRSRFTEEGLVWNGQSMRMSDLAAVRFTGSFDGVQLIPTCMEYVPDQLLRDTLNANHVQVYDTHNIIRTYDLPWTVIYQHPEAVPAGEEQVTLYAIHVQTNCWEPSPAFAQYPSLAHYVADVGPGMPDLTYKDHQWDGHAMILGYDRYYYYDPSLPEEHNADPFYSADSSAHETGSARILYYAVKAVWFSPWRSAVVALWKIYLWTFCMGAVLVLIARRMLKSYLIVPIRDINYGFANPRSAGFYLPDSRPAWREPAELYDHYDRVQTLLQRQQTEQTRLQTALDYAKEAEENRRQMTSNIAHELKTPLAVIHSYAEGLKERIAEDKREKYLDVILSETQRTDAMVLEMLDLSRLEAGRIKLTREEFCLCTLAKATFERLDMAAKAKDLQVTFNLPRECKVRADEGRIGQVVENFASNAVKYTPVGGKIHVSLRSGWFGTTFTVENDSPPLTQEQLSRVWDTFYRVDEARTGGGTGLGLAIAKSIISLHGGKCQAYNTRTGVAFSFTL